MNAVESMVTGEPSSVVALSSEYPSPRLIVCGLAPVSVMIGAVVSTTFTVLVTVAAAFPEASVES